MMKSRSGTSCFVCFWLLVLTTASFTCGQQAPKGQNTGHKYPAIWFAEVIDPNKPVWEILPQEAKPGEVILSKRNELGILSNFAATPFKLYGKQTRECRWGVGS
jgi:hypothetical protein